jgi:hypothetical protein
LPFTSNVLPLPTVKVPVLLTVKFPAVVKFAPPLIVKLSLEEFVARLVSAFAPLWFSIPALVPVRVTV